MALPDRAAWHRRIPAMWQERGIAALALWPVSQLYRMLAAWQRQRARQASWRAPVPVLVVGNVIAGGAGKTPTTIAVAQHFRAQGVAVGIVSRGYGRSAQAPELVVVHPDTDAAVAGDEPVLIRQHTGAPVVVCADRVRAAQELLTLFPDTRLILCDDGLQHHALQRDGEICVMDERGVGNGWLLPAGPLREPWPRRVDAVLLTGKPLRPFAVPPGQAMYQARRFLHDDAVRADGRRQPLQQWVRQRQSVIAVAGIAQPDRFFAMLESTGLTLAERHALPDHASPDELAALARACMSSRLPVLCTEKDAVKLWNSLPQAWAVPLRLEPERAFFAALTAWWLAQAPRFGRKAAAQ